MHSVDDDEVGLSPPLLAEAQFVVCVICALFNMGENWGVAKGNCCCTTSPVSLSHLRTKADEGRLAAEEPNQPRCIIQVLGRKVKESARSLIERRVEPWVA